MILFQELLKLISIESVHKRERRKAQRQLDRARRQQEQGRRQQEEERERNERSGQQSRRNEINTSAPIPLTWIVVPDSSKDTISLPSPAHTA